MSDILVIGGGPAGITAAIYALRAGCSVTVVYRDGGALLKTDKIENYYGFPEPISGRQLFENGHRQAVRLGAVLQETEVLELGFDGRGFVVGLSQGESTATAVILSTGAVHVTPKIDGLKRLEGSGVSYCAICDAFFYRGKAVGVLGAGDYALHEAETLLPVAASVTLLTDGKPVPDTLPDSLQIDTRHIQALTGDTRIEGVQFDEGEPLPIDGLFVALGVAGSDALARKIGAAVEGTRILTDEHMAATVPGLFAAGDCTGGLKQVAKAVHEGAVAGMAAAQYVRAKRA